jgi:hypothetical protein
MSEAQSEAKVLVLAEFEDFDLCMPEGGKRGVDSYWRKKATYAESRKDKRHALRPKLTEKRRNKVMPHVETDEAIVPRFVTPEGVEDPVVIALRNARVRPPLKLSLSPEEQAEADRRQAEVHAMRERGLAAVEARDFVKREVIESWLATPMEVKSEDVADVEFLPTCETIEPIRLKTPLPASLSQPQVPKVRRKGLKPTDADYDDRELERARDQVAASVSKRPPYKGVKGGMLLAGYIGENW